METIEISALQQLPAELLSQIVGYVYPPDIVNFARTCRKCRSCSATVIELHRKRAREREILRDMIPSSLIDIVRLFLYQRDQASYTRAVVLSNNIGISSNASCDDDDLGNALSTFMMSELKLSVDKTTQYLNILLKGDLSVLRVLLMTLCPRLDTLILVKQRTMDDSNPHGLLDAIVQSLHAYYGHHYQWSYLNNVRKIRIGVDVIDRAFPSSGFYRPSWAETASLLLLPSLETASFHRINYDNVGGTYQWQWQGTKSSVQTLIFDNDTDGNFTTFKSLLSSIKSLKVIEGFNWRLSKDQFLSALAQYQAASLERLDLASFSRNSTLNQSDVLFLHQLPQLKEIEFAIHDLTPGIPSFGPHGDVNRWLRQNSNTTVRYDLGKILPASIESIRISDQVFQPIQSECKTFVEMLEDLVESKSKGAFSNLHTLCLHGVCHGTSMRLFGLGMSHRPGYGPAGLAHLQHLCQRNGVHFHDWTDSKYALALCRACVRKSEMKSTQKSQSRLLAKDNRQPGYYRYAWASEA